MKITEFLFEINRNKNTQISTQIYENIKKAILNAEYVYGDKLPSVRMACELLGVSKSSVISAYFQLNTEGFIKNIACKGYYVSNISKFEDKNYEFDLEYKENNIIYINDAIDKRAVSKDIWKKHYNKMLSDESIDLSIQGDEQGELELREAVADYVRAHRGCKVGAHQIIIASGIQTLIAMLVKICSASYEHAYLESPGYKKAQYVFEDYKVPIKKISVNENGINIEDIKHKKSFIYVSPSFQYPMGNSMTIDKRHELIKYAESSKSLIIEDDYAATIRYDSKPISSLMGLDIYDNTVYLGSFSKTFLPSLRISFMILPSKLLPSYFALKAKYTHTCSKLDQLTLASIISGGFMEKHLKKINALYKQKNLVITKYIKEHYKNKLIVNNSQSGFHIILSCKTKRAYETKEELKNEFLLIDIISYENENLTFLLSYSGLDVEEIPQIVDKIAKLLCL